MAKSKKLRVDGLLLKTAGDPRRNAKQMEFLKCTAKYVAYGGAKGGGKSFALRFKAILLAFAYPGIRMLLIRRTLPELKENHTLALKAVFAKLPKILRPTYSEEEKAFRFPWGSRLKLGYCDSENDVLQYQGLEYDVVFVDEATQLTESQFSWLDACLRGVNGFPKRMYLTCNPGGIGHAWVQRLFIKREYRQNENPSDYAFIAAKVWDNQPLFDTDRGYIAALTAAMKEHGLTEPDENCIRYAKEQADYVQRLKNLPHHLKEAWLNGRWDVFAGQYFGEFDFDTHTCEPFEIPDNWRKSVSLDYGLDMFAALFIATDEQGCAWVYWEINRPDLIISAAAEALRRNTPEGERIEENIAPPDLWNRRQDTGRSAAEVFAENGVPLVRSGNDRVSGWLNLKEWLRPAGPEKKPRLKVFRTCTNLMKCLPLLQHDETRPNDVSTEPHELTHAPDALRYWASRRHLFAEPATEADIVNFEFERRSDGLNMGDVDEDYLFGGY